MLKSDFVVVAIDQAYQRRQKDAEGDFFRKISKQSPRTPGGTQQGLYAAAPNGTLLGFTNNRSPARVQKMLLEATEGKIETAEGITDPKRDRRYSPEPPVGGLVVRMNAKVLDGYDQPKNDSEKIFQQAVSRDNLWITKDEHTALVSGTVPELLQRRIARFHLVDNTRGEPTMWKDAEIVSCEMSIEGSTFRGKAHLRSRKSDREFQCELLGRIATKDGQVTRFDVVAKGGFRGEGRYTKRAPKGTFPLAIAFTLADMRDIADKIPPQGSRGWVDGYMKLR